MKKKTGQEIESKEKEMEELKVVESLQSQILKCLKVSQSVSLALAEKGILNPKDINAARQKIDDYGKGAEGIDWDKFDWEKIKTLH